MATLLVHISLLAYVASAAAYLGWLLGARHGVEEPAGSRREKLVVAGRALLFVGLALHVASFAVAHAAGLASAGFGSEEWKGGQLFSLLAAATVAGYLALDLRYKLPVAGAFVAPFTVAVMVPAHLVRSQAHAIAPGVTHSVVLAVHVGSASLGTAILGLAFGLALLYLASERQLKRKNPGRLFQKLPSLNLIDHLGYLLSVWGFVFLSVAIGTGSLVSRAEGGSTLPMEPKQWFAILTWALFASLIQARLVAGWRGRRVAILVVAGFVLLMGSYAGLFGAAPKASAVAWAVLR